MEINCPHCGKEIQLDIAKELGSKGGEATKKKYGKDHFKKIAKGWPKGKKRKLTNSTDNKTE